MNPASVTDTIVQKILIKAPAERVFEALINPAQRVQWWGAEGRFQATQMESDLRPGGAWKISGNGVDGTPFTVKGRYLQIDRPCLLSFTWLPDWQEDAFEHVNRFPKCPFNHVVLLSPTVRWDRASECDIAATQMQI
jgi:uncharacterized protein YndB with AHSA1/START domain